MNVRSSARVPNRISRAHACFLPSRHYSSGVATIRISRALSRIGFGFLVLPAIMGCSLLAPTDKSLFGGAAGSVDRDAEVDDDSGVLDASIGGSNTSPKSTAPQGGSSATGGKTSSGIGGVPSGGTSARTGGTAAASGGTTASTGGAAAATGGASPNGNCTYGSTGNNGDPCSVGEGIWRCVVSSAQDGVWVSQVCQKGEWVTFHLNPRDCAGCCGAESSACCQADHACSLLD